MSTCIIENFSTLKDPRIERHMLHSLTDIIVLSICAMSSGSDGWEAIEDFGKEKEDWLRQYIPLAPSPLREKVGMRGIDVRIFGTINITLTLSFFVHT
jgi:hypothetical protein